MKRLFIFFLLSVIYLGLKAQSSEKIIPFVLYNPVRFSAEIEGAFISKQQYIKVRASSADTSYFICLDELKNGEKAISKEYLENKGVDIAILNTSDSIFFLCITPYSLYNSSIEICGRKEKGKYHFRKPSIKDNYQSFENLIKKKYASTEVFKYYYLKNQEDCLTYSWDLNGLLEADPSKAYNFLKNDYVMYEIYNPNDTVKIVNMFMTLISKFSQIKPDQDSYLKTKILAEIKDKPLKLTPLDHFVSHNRKAEFVLKGANLVTILTNTLDTEQLSMVLENLRIHRTKREFYYDNMRMMCPVYQRIVKDYFHFSDESLKQLSCLIFESDQWDCNEK